MNQRVCTVRGQDHRGMPLSVTVEACSLREAAAPAWRRSVRAGGQPSLLTVTMHEPKSEWKVTTEQLAKYVSGFADGDNVRLRQVKRNVKAFLAEGKLEPDP